MTRKKAEWNATGNTIKWLKLIRRYFARWMRLAPQKRKRIVLDVTWARARDSGIYNANFFRARQQWQRFYLDCNAIARCTPKNLWSETKILITQRRMPEWGSGKQTSNKNQKISAFLSFLIWFLLAKFAHDLPPCTSNVDWIAIHGSRYFSKIAHLNGIKWAIRMVNGCDYCSNYGTIAIKVVATDCAPSWLVVFQIENSVIIIALCLPRTLCWRTCVHSYSLFAK